MTETARLLKYLSSKEESFEKKCARCGRCCGSEDDPCVHLKKVTRGGRHFCKIYGDHLGRRRTVSGKTFICVPIKQHIRNRTLEPGCVYKKQNG